MKFPTTIKHRKAEVVIYGKTSSYPFYRIAYRVDGKRKQKSFASFQSAKDEGERIVKSIAAGSPAAALTSAEARDAIAALQRLRDLGHVTGKNVGLLVAASEYAEAVTRLAGKPLLPVIDQYVSTMANVSRKDISQAVEEFVNLRKPLTEAKAGKRPQLSKNYVNLGSGWLKTFAASFSSTAVCDLTKDHLNVYMGGLSHLAPKSRNHVRSAIKMFFRWCVRRDYLSPAHRLFEADGMSPERADISEIDYYKPGELEAILNKCAANSKHSEILPVIVLNGLAGLRLEECLRLDWEDVWSIPGHIEVKAVKAKTRARRLVDFCAAANSWLMPYRQMSGPIYAKCNDTFHFAFNNLRKTLKIPARRNGMRHAFCTYHFALHSNENFTAAQAGNSPSMIHAHYKGLATKSEAEKWFEVRRAEASNVVAFQIQQAV